MTSRQMPFRPAFGLVLLVIVLGFLPASRAGAQPAPVDAQPVRSAELASETRWHDMEIWNGRRLIVARFWLPSSGVRPAGNEAEWKVHRMEIINGSLYSVAHFFIPAGGIKPAVDIGPPRVNGLRPASDSGAATHRMEIVNGKSGATYEFRIPRKSTK